MVGNGPRLVDAPPAQEARSPREVDVGGPELEILVEHSSLDGAVVEHLAPVQRRGPVDPERLRKGVVRQGGPAVSHDGVLASPVDHHARGVDRVQPLLGPRAFRADELRRDRADVGLFEVGARVRQEPRLEEAVGVQ
jgi:hypothetical protein